MPDGLTRRVLTRLAPSGRLRATHYGVARPFGSRQTDDILLAKQALYQLSYGPIRERS